MIPLNFYRDDEYVYYNNPNGITKKMTIADFEAMMSGEGGTGAFIVQMTALTMVTDKTFGEMYEAWQKNIPIFVKVKFSDDEYMSPVVNMTVEYDDEELIAMSFKLVNYKENVEIFTFIPDSGNNDFACKEWKLQGGGD